MGSLRVEIWSPPGIATFERRIAGIHGVSNLSGTVYRRQLGQGQFTLPADYSRLGEIVDVDPSNHANDVASLARVYRGTSLIQEFLVDGTPNVISETPTQIAGPTVEAVMDWAIVEAWDWDGSDDFTSRFPDWIYGGRNVLVDPTFSDPQCSPRISDFWTNATSGSWTATVDGQTTAGIAFNATATQVEVAYEALSTVTDVLVEGNGSAETPWRVTFVDPCFPTTYSVSSGTLNGNGIVATLIEQGSQQPAGWTESRTVGFGVPIIFGNYTNFEVDIAPGTHPCGGTNALHIQAATPVGFSYPGAQTTPRVEPGGLYQAGVWVYSQGTADEVRLVIRPVTEEPLIDSSIWPSTTLVANTWTFLSIADVMIPEGVDRVIFRVASVQNSHAVNLWVTCATLTEGLAATTVGEIMGDLLADAQTEHSPTRTTIDFINPSFTDALDSAGAAWDNDEVSISIPRGMTYRKVLESMFGPLGYEWNLTPTAGTPGEWDLNVWNPDGRVTDVTSADTPSLLVGQGTLNGYATKRVPRANIVTAEGQGGYSSRARNSASFPAIGRREGYAYDSGYIGSLVEGWADTLLAKFLTEGLAPRFDIADPNDDERPIPVVDYGLAYRLNVDLADGDGKVSRDIEAVSWRDSDEGLVWTIHTGQAQFDQPLVGGGSFGSPGLLRGGGGVSLGVLGPTVEGTRWLLDNFRRQQLIPTATALAPSGGGGTPTVVIAASDATDLSKSKADFICSGTNDHIVFQQAVDLIDRGRVVCTEGTFSFADTVYLPLRMTVQGLGIGTTTILASDDITDGFFQLSSQSLIHDILLDGLGFALPGFTFDNSSATRQDVIFRNVLINGVNGCIVASDTRIDRFVIDGCTLLGNGGSTVGLISMEAATQGRIVNNDMLNNGAPHIEIGVASNTQATNLIIANNRSSGQSTTSGFIISRNGNGIPTGIVIADNFIRLHGTGPAIEVTDCLAVNISGNVLQANRHGIVAQLSTLTDATFHHNTIDGNVISGTATTPMSPAITVTGGTGHAVSGNNIWDMRADGIFLDGVTDGKVDGNSLRPHNSADDDTHTAIVVDGDRNDIQGNVVRPSLDGTKQWTVGVDILGDCNVAVGNNLADGWASSPIVDGGTDTQLKFPDDPAYGDNFVDCTPAPS